MYSFFIGFPLIWSNFLIVIYNQNQINQKNKKVVTEHWSTFRMRVWYNLRQLSIPKKIRMPDSKSNNKLVVRIQCNSKSDDKNTFPTTKAGWESTLQIYSKLASFKNSALTNWANSDSINFVFLVIKRDSNFFSGRFFFERIIYSFY